MISIHNRDSYASLWCLTKEGVWLNKGSLIQTRVAGTSSLPSLSVILRLVFRSSHRNVGYSHPLTHSCMLIHMFKGVSDWVPFHLTRDPATK